MTELAKKSDSDFYLLKNKQGKPAWRTERPNPPNLIVVHVAASSNMAVGYTRKQIRELDRNDSAQRVARYAAAATTRTSWHSSTDERDIIPMLPDEYVAYHCRSQNERSLGIELCCRVQDWGKNKDFDYLMVEVASAVIAKWCAKFDIPVRRLSREECAAGESGLVAHSDADPKVGRKVDPGKRFDWELLLDLVAQRLATPKPAPAPTLLPRHPNAATVAALTDDEIVALRRLLAKEK